MKFAKTNPDISFVEFAKRISSVKEFAGSTGKRYKVIDNNTFTIVFNRLDSNNPQAAWGIEVADLFSAFKKLDNFATINFKPFIPIRHSPARGLLIKIGLLIPVK